MAVSGNTDGSIILRTQVDTSGLNKGMNSLKGSASSLTSSFNKLAIAVGLAFSVSKIIQFSKEASDLAIKTEASMRRLVDIYGEANKEVTEFIEQNALALGIAESSAASFAAVYGNLFSVWADQATNARLTTHYLNMTSVVASKTGRTMEDVQERIRSGLLGNTEAIEDLGIFVNVKTIQMTSAFQRVANGRSWEQLTAYEQQQVRTLAILEQATDKYGTQVENTTSLTQARYRAAWQDFKATWGQVVNKILMPIMKWLTTVLLYATRALQVLFNLSDSVEETQPKNGVKWWKKLVDNQKEVTDEVKATEKAVKGMLAGFDELNVITQETAETDLSETLGNVNLDIEPVGDIDSLLDSETMKNLNEFEQWMRDHRDEVILGLEVAGVGLLSAKLLGLGKNIGGVLGWFRKKDRGLQRQTRYTKRETSAVTDLAYAFSTVPAGNLLPWLNNVGQYGANIIPGLVLAGDAVWAFGELWEGFGSKATQTNATVSYNTGLFGSTISGILAGTELAVGANLTNMLTDLGAFSTNGMDILTTFATDSLLYLSDWAGQVQNVLGGAFSHNAYLNFAAGTPSTSGAAQTFDLISAIAQTFATGNTLNNLTLFGVRPWADQGGSGKSVWEALGDGLWDFSKAVLSAPGDLAKGVLDGVFGKNGLNVGGMVTGLVELPAEIGKATANILDFGVEKAEDAWNSTVVPFWNNEVIPFFADYAPKIAAGLGGALVVVLASAIAGKTGQNAALGWIKGFATGTVVPPNNPFLGILGDNTKETEVVSPLSTMKQAFLEALSTANLGGGQNQPIIIQIDGKEVARAVRTANGSMGTQSVFGGFNNAY